MPVITLTAGEMSKEKKKELIRRMVEVSSDVTGAPAQSHTVIIHEMPLDAVSVGPKTVEEFIAEMDH